MSKPRKINMGFELNSESPIITDAPCQSVDPEIFFPDPTDVIKTREAKSLCNKCNPLSKNQCLSFAMANKIQYGIWGGLTQDERKNLRRRESRHG
jgi:WhiB family redox-sensing transcriptional regulator